MINTSGSFAHEAATNGTPHQCYNGWHRGGSAASDTPSHTYFTVAQQATVIRQDNTVYFIGLTVQSSCTTCSTAATIWMFHPFTRQHVIRVSDDIITLSFVMSIRIASLDLVPRVHVCECVYMHYVYTYIYLYTYTHTHTNTDNLATETRVCNK